MQVQGGVWVGVKNYIDTTLHPNPDPVGRHTGHKAKLHESVLLLLQLKTL
jgi:hypothetical protein